MNSEQLKRGNEISQRLKFLNEQKEKYSNAEKLWDETFNVKNKNSTNAPVYHLHREFLDFNIIRTFALQKINDEISSLENEFNNL